MARSYRSRLRSGVVAGLLACSGALADEAATPTESGVVALDTIVVVASRAPEPLAQVVASVGVLDRERIETRLAQDIGDLTRYLPGIGVDSDAERFGRRGFAIRGLGGNRVRVEIDGVPLPDAFSVGAFAAAGRDLGTLDAIERIEILRGPASMLHGSDALAGIVAIRTRDPADMLVGVDEKDIVGLRTGFDGRDDGRWLGGAWAAEFGRGWQAMALLARREGEGVDNLARRAADAPNPADTRRDTLLTKLVRDAGDGVRWTLTLDHAAQDQRTDVRSQRFAPGRFVTTRQLDADDRAERDRLSVAAQWESPLRGIEALDLNVYRQDARTRQDTWQYRVPDRATPTETLRFRRFDFAQDDRGLELVAQSRGAWAGAEHWHVYGAELSRSRYEGLRDGLETNLASGATTTTILGETLPVRDFPNSTAERIALFWQDRVEWGELAVVPGLRWERYALDAHPDALFVEDFPRLGTADVRERRLVPKLGLGWTRGASTLFAQYVRGFRAPPFGDVNIGLTLANLNYEVRPNPGLRPERSRGLELGWRWHGEALRAEVVGFDSRFRDLIESRANLGVDPASGALVFQSVNRDRARIRGVEASFEAWLPRRRQWRAHGALSWIEGDDTARGVPLNTVDPPGAVLGLAYDATDGRWGGEFVAIAVRRKTRVDEGNGTLFAPPGHAVLDAFAWWSPQPGLRVQLGLRNLADRRYWTWASVRGVLTTAANLGFYTEPGRSVSLQASFEW